MHVSAEEDYLQAQHQAFMEWWCVSHETELAGITQAILCGQTVRLSYDMKSGRVTVSVIDHAIPKEDDNG